MAVDSPGGVVPFRPGISSVFRRESHQLSAARETLPGNTAGTLRFSFSLRSCRERMPFRAGLFRSHSSGAS
jgi:hypothetical protein